MNPLAYLRDNLAKLGCWLAHPAAARFHLNRALWDTGYPWTRLRPAAIEAIFPGIVAGGDAIQLVRPFALVRGTSLELEELVAVLAIVRHVGARRVLEVGTFNGHTALNLAVNLPADGMVVTIDLPPAGDPAALTTTSTTGPAAAGHARKAARSVPLPTPFGRRHYEGHPAAAKIRQVLADSTTLDWSSLGGPFDVAIIDGDHTSRAVASDTRGVRSVLAPGGVILWHDYEWRSVAKVIDGFAAAGEPIAWIKGTRFAVEGSVPSGRKVTAEPLL